MLHRIFTAMRGKLVKLGKSSWLQRYSTKSHIERLQKSGNINDWLLLIDSLHKQNLLSGHEMALVLAHEINPEGYVVNCFAAEIQGRCGASLQALADNPVSNVGSAINEIVKWKSTIQCADSHHRSKGYFVDAEPAMEHQWNKIIYPLIKDLDFTVVVDLACGHGRNSEKLRLFTKELHLVDINQSCLDACMERFGESSEGTDFLYHLTNGNDLHSISSNAATLVYSWDSMVHFDKLIVADYVKEIARILTPGGTAFIHHSNYGALRPDSDWAKNHGTRSDMSADLMNKYAGENGLKVVKQEIHGKEQGWGVENLDCVSLLYKPG